MRRLHYQRRRGTMTHANLAHQWQLAGYRFDCSRYLASGRRMFYPGRGWLALDALQ